MRYGSLAAGLTLLDGVAGGILVPSEAREAVWIGAALAFAIQVVLFVAFFVLMFASRPLLAHGLGMLGRFVAVVMLSFFWVPLAGLPAAPLLLSVVAVMFLTTLMEPIIFFRKAETSR